MKYVLLLALLAITSCSKDNEDEQEQLPPTEWGQQEYKPNNN